MNSSCISDVISTKLLKELFFFLFSLLSLLFYKIFNSLASGSFPNSFKHAIIHPLQKKTNWHPLSLKLQYAARRQVEHAHSKKLPFLCLVSLSLNLVMIKLRSFCSVLQMPSALLVLILAICQLISSPLLGI